MSTADLSEGARLSAWCEAVGRAVVELPAGAAAPVALDSLAVVSWNVHVGGGDVERLVGDLRSGAFTGGRPVHHFVLLLQEAYRAGGEVPARAAAVVAPRRVEEAPPGGERRDVLESARRLGLALLYVPSMRNGSAGAEEPPEDKGNAILSTLPLGEPEAVELPFEVQRRVVALATVQGATSGGRAWRLRVGSVHFDTRSPLGRFWTSAGAGRLRQARALAAAVGEQAPILLAGDMNSWSIASLEDALPYLRSRFPDVRRLDDTPTFTTGWGLRRTLDYFFFRAPGAPPVRYRRLDDRYGSDHYPLLGWVPVARTLPAPSLPF